MAGDFQNIIYTLLPWEAEAVEVQGVKIRLCPVKPSSNKGSFLSGNNLYIPIFTIHPNSQVTGCFTNSAQAWKMPASYCEVAFHP
jgi:hypothetical protein